MSMTALVAGISRAFDNTPFRFTNTSGAEQRVLTGNTRLFNTPKADDEFGQQFRLISICTDLRLNGSPAITSAQLRKWSAFMALQGVKEAAQGVAQPAAVGRQLRMMIGLAQKTNDPELETTLRRCQRWLRLRDNTDELFADIQPWATNPVDWDAP
jgi:hypothetical protein